MRRSYNQNSTIPVTVPFDIVVRYRNAMKMRRSSFNYRRNMRAGAFRFWRHPEDVFDDTEIERQLVRSVGRIVRRHVQSGATSTTRCVTIKHPTQWVGWSRAARLYRPLPAWTQTKIVYVNDHTTVHYVVDERVPSPRTNLITFVFRICTRKDGHINVFLRGCFPGKQFDLNSKGVMRDIQPEEFVMFNKSHFGY